MSTATKYDIVIFGATGFTGERVLYELLRSMTTGLAPRSTYTVAIAGRKASGLQAVIERARQQVPAFSGSIGTILADVADASSLAAMARSARLLLNCVGPYRFFGIPVVKAAAEAGCLYADITGEPEFMEKAELLFHDAAVKNNALCVSCCGFDSVPADIGAQFAADTLRSYGSGSGDGASSGGGGGPAGSGTGAVCTSIDSFFTVRGGPKGFAGHYATYESAVHGFGSVSDLRKTRAALQAKLYDSSASSSSSSSADAGSTEQAALLPTASSGLVWYGAKASRPKGSFFWSKAENRWALPFMGSDASVVRRTQRLLQHSGLLAPAAAGLGAKPAPLVPIQYAAYFTVKSSFYLGCVVFFGGLMSLFARFKLGQRILLAFPRLFTMGRFSHEGPSEEQMATTDFSMTFYAKGYSAALQKTVLDAPWSESQKRSGDGKGQAKPQVPSPDVQCVVRVSGPEPGYVATPKIMLACAFTLLEERDKLAIKSGVVTPGAAFLGSGLRQRLERLGISFTLVQAPGAIPARKD
jgi:hypothetical protein